MLVAVTGAKGSVGVTTLAYALARQWTSVRAPAVFVEADPDGGSVAARLGLCQEPGLATLAARARHDEGSSGLDRHLQRPTGSPPLLLLPSAPGHARAVLRAVADSLARPPSPADDGEPAAATDEGAQTLIADAGRLDGDSPALPLVQAAATVVVVGRPTLEGADAMAVRIAEMPELRAAIGIVTVGDGPYGGQELARALSVRCLGELPDHSAAVRSLWAGGRLRQRPGGPYLRAVSAIAGHLGDVDGQPGRAVR